MLIVDCGRPVARLEPVNPDVAPDDNRLARLIRAGIVRARSGQPARSVLSSRLPRRSGAPPRSPPCWTNAAKGVEWDGSALVPLLAAKPTTRTVQALAVRDPDMLGW